MNGPENGAPVATVELEDLRRENELLKGTNTELEEKVRELDGRISKLLAELAEYRRDRARTYVADAPQAHLVGEELRLLRDQELRAAGRIVLALLPRPPRSARERREAGARVRAVLAREVLLEEYERQRARMLQGELQTFVDTLADVPLSDEQRQTLSRMVADFEVETPPPPPLLSVWNALGFADPPGDEEADQELETLRTRAAELIAKVLATDPPGELWMDKPGLPFDGERHEAELGCEEDGPIRRPIYPGYRIGDRVIVKSTVFTGPEEEIAHGQKQGSEEQASREEASQEQAGQEQEQAGPAQADDPGDRLAGPR